MTIKLYGIPNCDTVKRARAWLAERQADVEFHDFKKQGVPLAELAPWLAALGRDRLINRKGTMWRKLDAQAQALADSDDGVRQLVVAQPSVIKRPLVRWPNGQITVGFDEPTWSALLAGRKG